MSVCLGSAANAAIRATTLLRSVFSAQTFVTKIEEIELLSFPLKAFLHDNCNYVNGKTIDTDVLWEQWKSWCARTNRMDVTGTKAWFRRNLKAKGMKIVHRGPKGHQRPHYFGLKFKTTVRTNPARDVMVTRGAVS